MAVSRAELSQITATGRRKSTLRFVSCYQSATAPISAAKPCYPLAHGDRSKHMDRRNFLMVGPTLGAAALVLTACSATVTKPDAEAGNAAKRREIDTAATATLSRLFATAPGSKDLADRAA